MAGNIRPKQFVDGEITVSKMSANSIDSDQYVDDSVDNAHLAVNSVSGSAAGGDNVIEPASIDTADLAADSADATIVDLVDDYTWTGAHDLTGGSVTVPTPSVAADAANKSYVDQTSVAGKTWKELLLVTEQLLNGGSGGILQAMATYIATNPAINDTFVISDGSTTETFKFVASASVAFDVTIGGSADATLTNLITAINADSTLWSAIAATGLKDYFAGAPANQAVVHRAATSVANDRLFSTVAVTSIIKVVEFATGGQDYTVVNGTEATLPAADPAAKRFGFGRVFANIGQNNTHKIVANNATFTWDGDDDFWQQTDAQAIVAGTGLTRAAYTLDVGAGNGINVNANDVEVDPDSSASASIAPVSVTVDGVGVTIDDDTITHSAGTLSASTPTVPDKNLTCSVTSSDGDAATAATVTATPKGDSYVAVFVNGIKYQVAANEAARATSVCYFSNDGGTTARTIADIASGDTIHWNGTVAGFELDGTDRMDLDYVT